MTTASSNKARTDETRFVFRILAGIISAFLLLVGLPSALAELLHSGVRFDTLFFAISCLYAGIGMATGARTGSWLLLRLK